MDSKQEKLLKAKNVELEKQLTQKIRDLGIEASLERLRAKAMAMQSSNELADLAAALFNELSKLDITLTRCMIWLMENDASSATVWMADPVADKAFSSRMKFFDLTYHKAFIKAWEERKQQWVYELKGKEKQVLNDLVFSMPGTANTPEEVKAAMIATERVTLSFSFSNFGGLQVDGIEPLSEENLDILSRFSKVFDQTYTRFNDLQKAEAQARESQIQLALERVRARTMAMQKSEELAETATVLFQQLLNLGISSERTFIGIPNDDTRKFELWGTEQGGHQMSTRFEYEADATYAFSEIYKAWLEKRSELTVILKGKNLEEHVNYVRNILHMPLLVGLVQKQRILYNAFFSKGLLMIVTPDIQLKETFEILKRFAGVFDGTYTRFLDLQKAEDQAREATIEAALERVRSRTMGMHNSNDVGETVTLMFNELIKLGVDKIARCGIAIPDNNGLIELWTAKLGRDEKEEIIIGHIDTAIHPMLDLLYHAWESKQAHFEYILEGDDLTNYITALNNYRGYPIKYEIGAWGAKQYHNDFFFHEGMVFAFTFQPLSAEIAAIFRRFAGVFGQTYRRFLDLQKAEAQAKESQIQLALERVRARTMAMQKSEELAEVIQLVYDQLCQLNFNIDNANFVVNYKESDDLDLWLAVNGQRYSTKMHIPYLDHPIFNHLKEAKEKGVSFFSDSFTFKEKNTFFQHFFKNALQIPQERKEAVFKSPGYARSVVFMKAIALSIQNYAAIPYSDAENAVLVRFGKVFEQTYTRFNDLKQAEEQAREAKIEAGLERVRSKAMAMRSSNDLNATANTVFIELRKLGVDLVRCGLGLMEKESHISTIHAATNSAVGGSLEVLGNIDMKIHPVLEGIYNQWRQNKDYFPVLEAESLRTYYEALHKSGISVPEWKSGEKQYGYFLQFAYGSLYAWSGKQESEITIKTLKRFTSVIGLTYTRYIELQKAESNTKEAIKQASLDRVRAEIASMRKRSDLERITPLIWDELTILGIPFIRCGVFIMDEEQKLIHTFLSTPDGKAIGAFHIPFDTSGNFEIMVDNWRHKEPYIDHWKEEAFSQFADALVKQGAIASKAQYMRTLPHEGVHLNFLPFLQGMLYVGNVSPFAEDNIDLIQAVADAFSTAYARYEDFNKLEAAKQQVDNTLSDLKAAQTKLIQSEKMASLGELTAGIAHEIQNPLNFVNNFSEVNQEMIEELEEELKAGNIEEALAIAADIKQNEEKISHHGKRADGIVKGMLQHSRTGGGEKQLTSMNVLADEFLRLSYHGLRAKDKTFNAEMVTNFDPDLPKISVIAQDMGRVLLNLFNNAFYAVNQKKKTALPDYRPEVSVTTLTENGQVIIKVKDNGTGMPDHVKEKIMQPFFTTKPTGEGTGLGLSLTYDMVVKGHGGKIDVNTNEGEYTEFIISLPLN